MPDEAFDVIVVGAGPSGLSAAITVARGGLHVAVLERGDYPGSKNLYGGILFSTVLNVLYPNFWEEAPVERHIVRRRLSFLTKDSEAGLDMRSERYNGPPYNNSFTVLRSRFDRWFADKGEKEGVELYTGVVVDDFVREDGRVVGIKARGEKPGTLDELAARCVICAEGANSLLAEKAGLRKGPSSMTVHNRVVAVKEILALPREIIEDRFHLAGDEGAAFEYFGDAVNGLLGSGFIYTNRESISVGVGCTIQDYISTRVAPHDQLDYFKEHPAIRNLLRGGELVEYSTHMIPEDTYDHLPEPVCDGLLLVGDTAGLVNTSVYHEVTNMAMASGVLAGETVLEAAKRGDFTRASLASYRTRLEDSFIFQDMRKYRKFIRFLESHREFLGLYPEAAVDLLVDFFSVTDQPKRALQREALRRFRRRVNVPKLLWDSWKARGALL